MKKILFSLLILGLLIGSVLPLAQPVRADDTGVTYPGIAASSANSGTGEDDYTWTNPNNIKVDDDTSAVFDPAAGSYFSYVLIARDFGFSIPVGSVIDGVLVAIQRRETSSDANIRDYRVQLYDNTIAGDNKALTLNEWPGSYTTASYGSSSDTWGLTLAVDDIESAWFMVQISARSVAGNGGAGSIDFVRVTVYYTPPSLPSVSTSATDNISCETATLNGEITDTGGATVDYYAFVWDTSSHGDPGDVEPSSSGYSDNWTSVLGNYAVDDYSHNIDSLNVDDTYYVRFAAHNSEGWSYGDEVDFDTLAIPTIITQSATDVTVSSARIQAYLDSDGGQACQVRFGWGESDESDNITAYDHYSVYAGSYTSGQSPFLDIDTLSAGTTYFFNVEAYGAGCDTDTGTSDNFTTESTVGIPSNVIAIPDVDNVTLSWVKGTGAPNTFIRFKMNDCPVDETDGTLIYPGTASTYTHEGLESGADYCYYLVGYDSVEGYSSGHVTIHATTLAAGLPADTEGEAIDKPVGGMTSSPAVSATLIEKIPILIFTQKDAAAIGMPHANFLYLIMLLVMMGLSYAVYRWTHEPMVIVAIWLIGVAWIARPILGIPLIVPIFITIVGAGYSVYRLRSVV